MNNHVAVQRDSPSGAWKVGNQDLIGRRTLSGRRPGGGATPSTRSSTRRGLPSTTWPSTPTAFKMVTFSRVGLTMPGYSGCAQYGQK